MFANNLDTILIVFSFFFSGFVTSRSIVPGISFPLISIVWLIFCLPFYYQRKILPINSTVFSVILFLFIVLFSGALNFGNQYSNGDTVSIFGSIALYFILISLLDSYDLIKKVLLVNIVITIPIVLVMSIRSWFFLNSMWLSPYWENNYALGKNTVGFFTVFCFNYLYAFFLHKKTVIKFLGLIILFIVTIYTISRGALISLAIIILLTPIFTSNKKSSISNIVMIIATYIMLVNIFNFNPISNFIDIKQRGNAALMDYQIDDISAGNFLNIFSSNSPGSKYGYSQRVSHWITTFKSFRIRPLFGSGVGSFRRNEGTLSHNDYLTITYEYGIVGLMLFFFIGFKHFYGAVKSKNLIPIKYRWIGEATLLQMIILAFTCLTVDSYMIPFTWYVLAISYAIGNTELKNPLTKST